MLCGECGADVALFLESSGATEVGFGDKSSMRGWAWENGSLAPIDRGHSEALWRRRSEEHTSELQSRQYLVCRLLLEKKTSNQYSTTPRMPNVRTQCVERTTKTASLVMLVIDYDSVASAMMLRMRSSAFRCL